MRKSYKELIQETLNQRAIIDNRQIVELSDTSKSVLIAFNQACEYMRDLHNWEWNLREELYVNDLGQELFPMPYGIVHKVLYKKGSDGKPCELDFVHELDAEEGCPYQWTHKWDTEEIKIAPAVSSDCDEISETIIQYHDKHIAVIGERSEGNLLKAFVLDNEEIPTEDQYLNVPDYIYSAYARCVILKTRLFLNENAQTTIFPAQTQEWQEAYNGLMSYVKTPYYSSKLEI